MPLCFTFKLSETYSFTSQSKGKSEAAVSNVEDYVRVLWWVWNWRFQFMILWWGSIGMDAQPLKHSAFILTRSLLVLLIFWRLKLDNSHSWIPLQLCSRYLPCIQARCKLKVVQCTVSISWELLFFFPQQWMLCSTVTWRFTVLFSPEGQMYWSVFSPKKCHHIIWPSSHTVASEASTLTSTIILEWPSSLQIISQPKLTKVDCVVCN